MAAPPADERQRQAWDEEEADDAVAGPSTEQVFEGEPVPTLPEMITARSVAVGVVLGVVLSAVAMKLSLTAVYLPFLAIPAGLMSFFLSRWWVRLLDGCGVAQLPFTRQENAVIQTFVVSCANIAYTGGFGSYILAMSRTSAVDGGPENSGGNVVEPQIGRLMAFLFLTSFVGVFAVMPFRNSLVIRHKPPVPHRHGHGALHQQHPHAARRQTSKHASVCHRQHRSVSRLHRCHTAPLPAAEVPPRRRRLPHRAPVRLLQHVRHRHDVREPRAHVRQDRRARLRLVGGAPERRRGRRARRRRHHAVRRHHRRRPHAGLQDGLPHPHLAARHAHQPCRRDGAWLRDQPAHLLDAVRGVQRRRRRARRPLRQGVPWHGHSRRLPAGVPQAQPAAQHGLLRRGAGQQRAPRGVRAEGVARRAVPPMHHRRRHRLLHAAQGTHRHFHREHRDVPVEEARRRRRASTVAGGRRRSDLRGRSRLRAPVHAHAVQGAPTDLPHVPVAKSE
ncbi:hypothetical protein GQ55_7G278500 [Panicum hallii var. hallii]|uniref:Uncharacterized protein n=1 Tax=Panicum hallii var. hallii TaxID=1504633 RepID=A0A2T7CZR8_9POAL|nr:hypothetical protein GQ55_7G278500 [Panicum hallii var. hallii]